LREIEPDLQIQTSKSSQAAGIVGDGAATTGAGILSTEFRKE
jgi:hypothetical protein